MRQSPISTEGRWDTRIFPGVDVPAVPHETRDQLAQALGALGVEAEYALRLFAPFTRGIPRQPATRAEGEQFLWQLDALARRLIVAANDFEVATQSYLNALELLNPELRPSVGHDGTWDDTLAPAWWPPSDPSGIDDGLVELSLRRCGYAYRHVVQAYLATNIAGIGEHLALLSHALETLPPAGVLPLANLYAGLYELAEALQGHMVPHYLRDVSPAMPGLLTGLTRLRELDATEDRSIDADLLWARAQLAHADLLAAKQPAAISSTGDVAKRGLLAIFRRKPSPVPSGLNKSSAAAFAVQATREWTETIVALEALRQQLGADGSR